MSRQTNLGLMLAALFLVAACSSEPKQTQPVTTKTETGTSTAPPAKEAERRDNALVRVINTVPGATFDIYADNQKVFEGVSFKSVAPYKELSDDRHTFRIRPAGQDNAPPIVENSEGLSGGKHYTIVVMPGTNDKVALNVLNDNITPPPTDKAEVRVIHASPDAGEVDIVAKEGNKKLFSGVNFERGTSYTDVEPMKTTLEVRPEGKDTPVLTVPNANFEKGKIYTIVVAGRAKGMPKLQAIMVEDHLGTEAAASTAQNPSTSEKEKMMKTKSSKY
jgi:uncharacterized protein DUF4397